MAFEKPVLTNSFEVAGDMSTKQYYFMKLDANGRVTVCTGATDKPIGVLLNKPDTLGKAAEIGIIGIFSVSSDAALNEADLIGPSGDGQADAKTPGSDTTEFVCGQVLQASGAAAELAVAAINCANPFRAA